MKKLVALFFLCSNLIYAQTYSKLLTTEESLSETVFGHQLYEDILFVSSTKQNVDETINVTLYKVQASTGDTLKTTSLNNGYRTAGMHLENNKLYSVGAYLDSLPTLSVMILDLDLNVENIMHYKVHDSLDVVVYESVIFNKELFIIGNDKNSTLFNGGLLLHADLNETSIDSLEVIKSDDWDYITKVKKVENKLFVTYGSLDSDNVYTYCYSSYNHQPFTNDKDIQTISYDFLDGYINFEINESRYSILSYTNQDPEVISSLEGRHYIKTLEGYNENLDKIWTYHITLDTLNYERIDQVLVKDISTCSNGDFLITGWVSSDSIRGFITRVDQYGNHNFTKTYNYNHESNQPYESIIKYIDEDEEGYLIASGSTYETPVNNTKAWISRLDENGCLIEENVCITSSTKPVETQSITIFPNPVHNILHVTSEDPIRALRILSLDGSLVMNSDNIDAAQFTVDVSILPTGVYIGQLEEINYSSTYQILIKN